jgi:hypothetical protein
MVDNPITEKRLVELFIEFEQRFEQRLDKKLDTRFEEQEARLDKKLDTRFEEQEAQLDKKIDEKLKPILTTITELNGFKNYEANSIELELQLILQKYLKSEYPTRDIQIFSTKKICDPYTGKPITDLDAAFIIKSIIHEVDSDRFKKAGIFIPSKESIKEDYIFVLAEAKHHLDKGKIADKLLQFDRICELFRSVKKILETRNTAGYHAKFIRSVPHNLYFANITECMLFFGAAYWDKGLLEKLQIAVNKYRTLLQAFRFPVKIEDKVKIYKDIIKLESQWYPDNKIYRNELSDIQIKECKCIHGALENIRFIYPSGERYHVEKNSVPAGLSHIALKGGNRK